VDDHPEPPSRPTGRLRGAANRYRRRVEEEALAAKARLLAADVLADALEAEGGSLTDSVRSALKAYREAARPTS
jgi:hypothetical protein